jgi:exosortase B
MQVAESQGVNQVSLQRSFFQQVQGLGWQGLVVAVGLAALFAPTFNDLANGLWKGDEQGHGPIILVVAMWFLWRKREALTALPAQPHLLLGYGSLVLAMLLYAVGRSQAILMFEVGALIPTLAGLLLLSRGVAGLRTAWFPLFFLLFMVPLPDVLVSTMTTPLKSLVSAAAASIMSGLGYPVGRSGVILTVGQYQLLVADACAGLNSMFTLEALGLIYMQLMNYTSPWRNSFLAIVLIPISVMANIVRVIILVLVTYHFGDEAGQGFVHGFAGMVLFMVALMMMLVVDNLWGWVLRRVRPEKA